MARTSLPANANFTEAIFLRARWPRLRLADELRVVVQFPSDLRYSRVRNCQQGSRTVDGWIGDEGSAEAVAGDVEVARHVLAKQRDVGGGLRRAVADRQRAASVEARGQLRPA